MKLLVIVVNVLGWPMIQLTLAKLFLLLPDSFFAEDTWLTRERSLEGNGSLYRRFLMIQRWKGLLPDGASWLGGRPKKNVASRNPSELIFFATETRRSEIAHWCMFLCTPTFYIWNPQWACVVMTLYGIAANLPCILVQRANRIKVRRILHGADAEESLQVPPVESIRTAS